MKKKKVDCYKCKFRGTVSGSAHSSCNYPNNDTNLFTGGMSVNNKANIEKLNIMANYRGIKNGWFIWPMNFNPVWLDNCNGFEEK